MYYGANSVHVTHVKTSDLSGNGRIGRMLMMIALFKAIFYFHTKQYLSTWVTKVCTFTFTISLLSAFTSLAILLWHLCLISKAFLAVQEPALKLAQTGRRITKIISVLHSDVQWIHEPKLLTYIWPFLENEAVGHIWQVGFKLENRALRKALCYGVV